LQLGIVGDNPTAPLNHHKNNIASAPQWPVGAARRHRELGDLRNIVREDGATENTR
jgi:hypothetical protein